VSARILAVFIAGVTVFLVVVGTIWPGSAALAMAGASRPTLLHNSASPQEALTTLLQDISQKDWNAAYSRLANKSEFTEAEFIRDLTGGYFSLRSYAALDAFDLRPLHASADEAVVDVTFHWSTVVGTFQDVRKLRVIRSGDLWQAIWPLVKEPRVPPQVIPVNYLRWDVIYRGPEDDWGAQDVEAPHIRIVDMNPVNRGGGVVVLGEILNEDVVPAFVTVKATLLAKGGSAMATEDAFDKISHILLPKQVTPFRIDFHHVSLSQVDSIRMQPSASLIAASADPVIEIEDQKLNPLPDASLTGRLLDQSGQVVNIAHVLAAFYDNRGQVVWVSDEYGDRALVPQTPEAFTIPLPSDLASKITNYRVIASTYSSNRFQ